MKLDFPLLEDFIYYLKNKGRKESTIARYSYDIHYFYQFIQKEKDITTTKWQNISLKDYEHFIQYLKTGKKCSNNTLYKTTIVLKSFQNFLQFYYETNNNPAIKIELELAGQTKLNEHDFLTDKECYKIIQSLHSLEGFTNHQLEARQKLKKRNLVIFLLLIQYGLTLKELISINMNDISFVSHVVTIHNKNENNRKITLNESEFKLLYEYIKEIPEPVRPKYNSSDPLLVAFDFNRKTFKWVYETDSPKRMSAIAVQKLIREQMKRADVRKGVCAQTFRNTFILSLLQNSNSKEKTLYSIGNLSKNSLKRYDYFLLHCTQSFLDSLYKFRHNWYEATNVL